MHLAETGIKPLRSNRSTHGKGMSLSQRTARILYSTGNIALRMPGGYTTPLTELLQVL